MTEQQLPLERMLAGWMADEATGAPEPILAEILATTGRIRPRPRWWALLVERPMRSGRARVAVGLANRGLVYAALIALLLAGLAALAIGASILLNRAGPADPADWSGFRGNADHAGVGLQGPTGNPVLAWQFHAHGAVLEVAIVGDHVFFAADDGTLSAVTREGGVTRWAVAVPNPPLVGPYAADGRLYVTDANGKPDVASIAVPPDANVIAMYAGTVIKSSANPSASNAFLTWLAGPDGQAVLSGFGFLPPT